MKYVLLLAVAVAFGYVTYEATLGDAASTRLVGAYIAASVAALALSAAQPAWSARIKWVWVALSIVVIVSIFIGPLNYLRLQ